MTAKILVVDDDPHIREIVCFALTSAGMETCVAADGAAALAAAETEKPDLIVLDIGLPEVDGLEVCRRLRKAGNQPILFLSSRSEEIDRVIGIELGGDDYMVKPFSPRELVARIQAMLRRPRNAASNDGRNGAGQEVPARTFGELRIDVAGREVHVGERLITLTRTEFDVLAALSSRPGLVFSRRRLIEGVWGESWVGNEHLVDVHIGHLRRKLGDDPALPRYVSTVRGVGYRMGSGQ
jgi:DNA-binding response OmpR family regulator